MPEVPIRVLRLYTSRAFTHTGTHLRGAILTRFPDRELLHNRREDGVARLPDTRFVVQDRVPHVVAIGPGRHEVVDLYRNLKTIPVPNGEYEVTSAELLDEPIEVGVRPQLHRYQSSTHWLGLNQQNHQTYQNTKTTEDRRELLQRVIVGNFLMSLRQLGVELAPDERILASIEDWQEKPVEVRGQRFLGFRIRLTSNLQWSPWIGIGKQVAKGFGRLEQAAA